MKQLFVVTTIRSRMDGRLPPSQAVHAQRADLPHNCLHPGGRGALPAVVMGALNGTSQRGRTSEVLGTASASDFKRLRG